MVGETNTSLTETDGPGGPDPVLSPQANSFLSVDFLNQSAGKSVIEVYLYTNDYKKLLIEDFRKLQIDPADALMAAGVADDLFSSTGIIRRLWYSPVAQINAWEHVLGIMAADDPAKYQNIHKGTPFYFLGMASYLARDFEKALFYMDAALEEDLRLHKDRWFELPSGKFVLFDDRTNNQAAKELVTITRKIFEDVMREVTSSSGISLSLDELRDKLVKPAMTPGSIKRSAVTGVFTFLLEFSSRAKELSLAGTPTSTGEPFFLHLFKGALLFETLLKTSPAGGVIKSVNRKATINNFLNDGSIYSAFGFTAAPQGFGAQTFDDVIAEIKNDTTPDFTQRAVRATWGIRNTTGHSLAWPYRPDPEEYKELFQLIVAALSATLSKLHP